MKNIIYTRQTINSFFKNKKIMTLSPLQGIGFSVASLNGLNLVLAQKDDKIYNNKIQTVFFSTNTKICLRSKGLHTLSQPIIPVKIYANADILKLDILTQNKNKSGIYCFTNLTSGKKYIGSSVDLRKRLVQYFNMSYLTRTTYMPICSALLKYGYSSFSLEILEYCDSSELLIREKHYFDLLNPGYNLSKHPSHPFLGRTHTDEARAKLSAFFKGKVYPERSGEKNPMFGKTHSEVIRLKISEGKKGKSMIRTDEHNAAISSSMLGKNKGVNSLLSKKVLCTDLLTNESTVYFSHREAARALNITQARISSFIERKQVKAYKKRYVFKPID